MLTYERYQALRAIYIRVPGEPGNEAIVMQLVREQSSFHTRDSCVYWSRNGTMFPVSHWVNWEEGTESGMDVTRGRRLLDSSSDRRSAWEEGEGIGGDRISIPRVSIGRGNDPMYVEDKSLNCVSWCVSHGVCLTVIFYCILIHVN